MGLQESGSSSRPVPGEVPPSLQRVSDSRRKDTSRREGCGRRPASPSATYPSTTGHSEPVSQAIAWLLGSHWPSPGGGCWCRPGGCLGLDHSLLGAGEWDPFCGGGFPRAWVHRAGLHSA